MKIFKKILLLFLFLFLVVSLFLYSKDIISSIQVATNLWANKVVPSLLPFFLISNFLLNYGLVEILSEVLKPLTHFLRLNENSAFIIVMSLISGSPSNAYYTKEALHNGLINEKDATKVLMISHFASPLFILGTVFLFLNDYTICLFILIVTYIVNLILAIVCKKLYPSNNHSTFSFQNIKKKLTDSPTKSIGKILSESIKKTSETLIIILGSICFFFIISTVVQNLCNFSDLINTIFSGVLEMTQGIQKVGLLNCSLKLKTILIAIFLSFGGFSIHSQVASIISDTKIKYLPYFLARLLHALIAGFLVFILFDYIY